MLLTLGASQTCVSQMKVNGVQDDEESLAGVILQCQEILSQTKVNKMNYEHSPDFTDNQTHFKLERALGRAHTFAYHKIGH